MISQRNGTLLKALNPHKLGKYKTTPGRIWTIKASTWTAALGNLQDRYNFRWVFLHETSLAETLIYNGRGKY